LAFFTFETRMGAFFGTPSLTYAYQKFTSLSMNANSTYTINRLEINMNAVNAIAEILSIFCWLL